MIQNFFILFFVFVIGCFHLKKNENKIPSGPFSNLNVCSWHWWWSVCGYKLFSTAMQHISYLRNPMIRVSKLIAKLGQYRRSNLSNLPQTVLFTWDYLPKCLCETSLNDRNWNCKVLTGFNRELPHRGRVQVKSSCLGNVVWDASGVQRGHLYGNCSHGHSLTTDRACWPCVR